MADYEFITSNGQNIPVVIVARRGVRNITLRPKMRPNFEIHITKPWLVTTKTALQFMEQKRKWLEQYFNNKTQRVHLQPGNTIKIFDRNVFLQHDPSCRANKYIEIDAEHGTLIVGGGADMFERRVRDYIRTEFITVARQMIKNVPQDLWPTRIAVRDTTTRWGSCSSTGTISFSWRLAFAPRDVMRYVVMHELAHRRYMDHSPAFWNFVGDLYGFGVERAKRWLKVNGGSLHQYF